VQSLTSNRRARLDVSLGVLAIAVVVPALADAQDTRADAPIPHARGQSVSASFEGWYPNSDGTRSLVFGYFNRNYEQHLDIPVGPENAFSPGVADRGQPTHFLPRRQTGVFAVVVPTDFGDQLIWTLTANDETIAIPGHVRPEWEITALEEVTSGNTPPVVRFGGATGDPGQGPLGVRGTLTATALTPAALTVWATDDQVRRARNAQRAPSLGLVWSKYRGPGTVTFDDATPAIDSMSRSDTTVTFSQPGEYVLRVLAWDDSGGQSAIMAGGFFCCWTNAYVSVQVQ